MLIGFCESISSMVGLKYCSVDHFQDVLMLVCLCIRLIWRRLLLVQASLVCLLRLGSLTEFWPKKSLEARIGSGMAVEDLAVASFLWNCNLAAHAGKHFSSCGSSPKASKLLWRRSLSFTA